MRQKTILIADDDPALVRVVSKRCEALGLNVKRAYNSFNALAIVRADKPDLVCCDVNMPDGNGLATCEILASNRKWSWIPLIVLTGREDAATIKKCHELGAYYVLKADNVWPRLEPLIRELLGLGPASSTDEATTPDAQMTTALPIVRSRKVSKPEVQPQRFHTLVVIDHDVATVRAIDEIVAPRGLIVLHCEGLLETEQVYEQAAAILCEYHLHALRGSFVVSELRRLGFKGPIIMMSQDGSRRAVIESISAGINGYLSKPFSAEELLETLRRHTDLELDEPARSHALA